MSTNCLDYKEIISYLHNFNNFFKKLSNQVQLLFKLYYILIKNYDVNSMHCYYKLNLFFIILAVSSADIFVLSIFIKFLNIFFPSPALEFNLCFSIELNKSFSLHSKSLFDSLYFNRFDVLFYIAFLLMWFLIQ